MTFDQDTGAALADAQRTGWLNAGFGTPCWDGYGSGTPRTWGKNYAGTTNALGPGREVLECMDGVRDQGDLTDNYASYNEDYYRPWYACSEATGENAYTWFVNNIGYIEALDTIPQDLVLAVATSPCAASGGVTTRANPSNSASGGGLWVIYHPPGGGALQYVHVDASYTGLNPDDDTTTACVEDFSTTAGEAQLGEDTSGADSFGTPAVQVDRRWFMKDTGVEGLHELRAFVATNSPACGVFEVRADLQYDASSDGWSVVATTPEVTELDYDGDISGSRIESAASGCKPFVYSDLEPTKYQDAIRGIELDPDGNWLLVYGGERYTYETEWPDGWDFKGVCAIHVGMERRDPTSTTAYTWPGTALGGSDPNPDPACTSRAYACAPKGVPYPAEQAVGRDLVWTTTSLMAHPYRSGMFFAGVNTDSCTDSACTGRVQAPYMLQRRTRAANPGYVWAWKQWTLGELQMPWGSSMEWGLADEDGVEVDRLYHGAAIGGLWEGRLWY